ncbi:MAG: hypothetical protein ACI8XM_001187 [Haloarculaceae archaeon]|jgi:hypothetical protein
MTNIQSDERRTDTNHTAEREPVSVVFKTGEEPEFGKPDHDPHGETFAAVNHSFTSCDGGCGTSGLVPTALLEDADGLTGWPPFDVLCESCANAVVRDDYSF